MTIKIKLLVATLLATLFFSTSVMAFSDSWYIYHGMAGNHEFSIRYPTSWIATTFSDNLVGFGVQNQADTFSVGVKVFNSDNYEDSIKGFAGQNMLIINSKDTIISPKLLGKEVTLQDDNTKDEYSAIFIKRGNVIIAIYPSQSNKDMELWKDMLSSFEFKDGIDVYVNEDENYTFSYPDFLVLNENEDVVSLNDSFRLNKTVFSVKKYDSDSIKNIARTLESKDEKYKGQEVFNFHGYRDSLQAISVNNNNKEEVLKIFVENKNGILEISDFENDSKTEDDYYKNIMQEVVSSFEIIDTEKGVSPFKFFPDVPNGSKYANSINALKSINLVDGDESGFFYPERKITRAELVEMVVGATKTEPDTKGECAKDVGNEWFASSMCYAEKEGWIKKDDKDMLNPQEEISKVEALKVVIDSTFGEIKDVDKNRKTWAKDIDMNRWYAKYFMFATDLHIIDNDPQMQMGSDLLYLPFDNISRGEVADIIFNSFVMSI